MSRGEPRGPIGAPITLSIPRAIVDEMVAHCSREAPIEACGLLSGRGPIVERIHILTNTARSEVRYDADPRELIEIDRFLRSQASDILAIYHSHPRWSAVPSKTDLRENYHEGTPRIIVSLLTDPADVRVWRYSSASYTELAWEIV